MCRVSFSKSRRVVDPGIKARDGRFCSKLASPKHDTFKPHRDRSLAVTLPLKTLAGREFTPTFIFLVISILYRHRPQIQPARESTLVNLSNSVQHSPGDYIAAL